MDRPAAAGSGGTRGRVPPMPGTAEHVLDRPVEDPSRPGPYAACQPVCRVGSSPPLAVLRVERRACWPTGPAASPPMGWLLPPQGEREGDASPLPGLQQVGPSPWGRRGDASRSSESSLRVLMVQRSQPIVTVPAGTDRSRQMKPLRRTHCALAARASVSRDRVESISRFK